MRSRVVIFIRVIYTRKTIHPMYINSEEEQLEQVNSFKYIRTVVNSVTLSRRKLTFWRRKYFF